MNAYRTALRLCKAFFGKRFKATLVEQAEFERPLYLFPAGECTQINYRTPGQVAEFAHAFRKPRPTLWISGDGKMALLVGGKWKFTARGFEP